jgi:hypothetical protein
LQDNLDFFNPGRLPVELGDKGFVYRPVKRDITGHDNTDPFLRVQIRCGCENEKNNEQYSQQGAV